MYLYNIQCDYFGLLGLDNQFILIIVGHISAQTHVQKILHLQM